MIFSNKSNIFCAGEELFAAALPVRLRSTPAFALERLPNRDSLIYGDLYGISKEASTIFRATLRYLGFGKIMNALGELGYFDTDPHPLLDSDAPPTYNAILDALLLQIFQNVEESEEKKFDPGENNSFAHALATLDCCRNDSTAAENAATCIRWVINIVYHWVSMLSIYFMSQYSLIQSLVQTGG